VYIRHCPGLRNSPKIGACAPLNSGVESREALTHLMITMASAAESLEGMTLSNGWRVKRKLPSGRDSSLLTGGCFSVGYAVEKNGKTAFLKALDFQKAFNSAFDGSNPADFMQKVVAMFAFEQDILETCRDAKIRQVVMLLDSGTVSVDTADEPKQTQYLIFEWAESDVRRATISSESYFDKPWALRCMHAITAGLYRLHSNGIVHQDIKPSNVLLFPENVAKIGDLGVAYSSHKESEHNKQRLFPGDRAYGPPERLYGYGTGNEEHIRKGADLYMLGSMLHFFFVKTPLTPIVLEKLSPDYHPMKRQWDREQIMPHLRTAHDRVVEEFAQAVHPEFRNELVGVLRQLTDPEPEKRGHPSNRRAHGNHLSLERFVSAFDRMSRAHSLMLRRGAST